MSTARRFFSWCPAKQKHGRGKSILRPPMCKNVVLLGLGHSARKSRKSHKSRKLRKSFGGYRLNHVQSRKSRKCCRPGTVFTYVCLRFQREVSAPSHVASAYARSFCAPFFLQCMIPTRPFSSFPVCSLLVEQSISPLRLSPPQSMPLPYESMLSFSSAAIRTSNLKTKRPQFVFQNAKVHKTVTHSHSTEET